MDKSRGQIQLIFGPMFSGKTTELVRRVKRYQIAKLNCVIINYDRSSSNQPRDSTEMFNRVVYTKQLVASDFDYEVIGIDEGQFFEDCVSFAEAMANMGKVVIIAALDGTYQRKSFGNILNLIPKSESVVKLNAICMSCFSSAPFTKRIGDEKEVKVIGGIEKYMAVCRDCHSMQNAVRNTPAPKTTPKKWFGRENVIHNTVTPPTDCT